jgi:hypothetical protein
LHDLATTGAQVLCATHSPLLAALPGALVDVSTPPASAGAVRGAEARSFSHQRPFSLGGRCSVLQVQDSNLRRHTPTDLQNVAAHALTCVFTAPRPNFGTISARPPLNLVAADAAAFPDGLKVTGT